MDKLVTAILFIGIPMALTQLIYRIIDRKGNKTAKLAERFPVLVKRKFLVQIGGAMAFVIVFGLISLLLDLPIKVFFHCVRSCSGRDKRHGGHAYVQRLVGCNVATGAK